jgi:hypothetical protein
MCSSRVAVLGVVIAAGASADQTGGAGWRQAPVCMEGRPDAQVMAAPAAVSRIFRDIGVKLDWRGDPRLCAASEKSIVITFAEAPAGLRPDSLAYALPYDRRTIVVFLDRVKARRFPPLLTYVLVHEIAHILQGIARHSEVGIMRPTWRAGDYTEMRHGTFAFAEHDVDLIHLGLDVWTLSAAAK